MTLEKAKLFEILEWTEGEDPRVSDQPYMTVQFNPSSLKVSYSNQVQTNGNNTSSAIQSVGKGDSKLAVELLFDVSGADATDSRDVRQMTRMVSYFLETFSDQSNQTGSGGQQPAGNTTGGNTGGQQAAQERYRVRGLRFQWGTFIFDGVVISMDETLDFWSEDGYPLRATVALNISQPGIHFKFTKNAKATPPPKTGNAPAGTNPLAAAVQGATLQGMVANAGIKADWKAVAAINGIENPRNLAAGTLVNLNVNANINAKVSAGASLNAGISSNTN